MTHMPTNLPLKLKWEQKEVIAGLILGLGNSMWCHLLITWYFWIYFIGCSGEKKHPKNSAWCAFHLFIYFGAMVELVEKSTIHHHFVGFKFQEALIVKRLILSVQGLEK